MRPTNHQNDSKEVIGDEEEPTLENTSEKLFLFRTNM